MRHAEVSYLGAADPAAVTLTERGRGQADTARRALEGVDFDLVVASTMARSIETAEIVAPQAEAEHWPELVEWRSGDVSGIAPEELERAIVRALLIVEEDECFLGGESLGEALDRVAVALERLVAREWETALAVLHGGVNRLLLSNALTGGGRAYYGNLEQAPACINVLDFADADWIVLDR